MFGLFEWKSWIGLPVAIAIALVFALLTVLVVSAVFRGASKRRQWPQALAGGAKYPFRLLVSIIAVWIAVTFTLPAAAVDWQENLDHLFRIAVIANSAWLLARILTFVISLGMSRYDIDIADNKVARRMQTQLALVNRLGNAVIAILAIAAILLTFPGVQTLGASLLASAGLLSIVAGLAAQSTLANVFAGVQLAFSEAIRVDDVVIAEKEWGRIEEITLTYVVVHIWDDRRLVLPSTYFTTTPFENWTRNSSELLGSIELDLDWRVSPSAMRQHLEVVLEKTDIWDGRASVLQVTDAIGGFVRIRILVTAIDAPTLFDLRCYVREEMVEWILTQDPAGMPRTRVEMVQETPRARPHDMEKTHTDQIGLFTGTADAEERALLFTAAIPIIRPHDYDTAEQPNSKLGLPMESEFETADELPDGHRPSR